MMASCSLRGRPRPAGAPLRASLFDKPLSGKKRFLEVFSGSSLFSSAGARFPSRFGGGGCLRLPWRGVGVLPACSTCGVGADHLLRHTYATEAVRGGAKLYGLRDLLGHANSATTSRYFHAEESELEAVAAVMPRVLGR